MQRIIITGSSGFIGSRLCKYLYDSGALIYCLVRNSKNIGLLDKYGNVVLVDLINSDNVEQVVRSINPDYVVNLAGSRNKYSDLGSIKKCYESNFDLSLCIIESCKLVKNFKGFIHIGTADEYGMCKTPFIETQREQPLNSYGLAKLSITKLLQAQYKTNSFPSIILRPTVIYGPGQSGDMFIPSIIKSLLNRNDYSMTSGEQTRDFVYIDDFIFSIALLISKDINFNGEVYNISSNHPIKIKDVALLIAEIVGNSSKDLIKFSSIKSRPYEVGNYYASNSKAREYLKWRPSISIEKGLSITVNSYNN